MTDKPKTEAEDAMNEPETFVPTHMRGGYMRFIERGIAPGSFGQAILRGDLEDARNRADHINANHIESQIAWAKKYVPAR